MLDERTRQFLIDHPVPADRVRELEAARARLESAAAVERDRMRRAGVDGLHRVKPMRRLGGSIRRDQLDARIDASLAALSERRAAFAGDCWYCNDAGVCARCDRGRAVAERDRADAWAARLEAWLLATGMSARQRAFRFDTFPAPHPSHALVERFVDHWNGADWLLLWGAYGTGKTGALCAALGDIAPRMCRDGKRALFVSEPDLYATLRAGFDGADVPDYRGCGLLVIDDMGAAALSGWAGGELFRIINGRLEHDLPTWFTSNVSPVELVRVMGDRVAQRVLSVCRAIELNGPNLRAV